MYNFLSLPVEIRDKIEEVDEKPGFVRLLYDPLYTEYIEPAIPRNFQAKKEYVPVGSMGIYCHGWAILAGTVLGLIVIYSVVASV